jgi:hypothetical protein
LPQPPLPQISNFMVFAIFLYPFGAIAQSSTGFLTTQKRNKILK